MGDCANSSRERGRRARTERARKRIIRRDSATRLVARPPRFIFIRVMNPTLADSIGSEISAPIDRLAQANELSHRRHHPNPGRSASSKFQMGSQSIGCGSNCVVIRRQTKTNTKNQMIIRIKLLLMLLSLNASLAGERVASHPFNETTQNNNNHLHYVTNGLSSNGFSGSTGTTSNHSGSTNSTAQTQQTSKPSYM